jgi:hypothetical protein
MSQQTHVSHDADGAQPQNGPRRDPRLLATVAYQRWDKPADTSQAAVIPAAWSNPSEATVRVQLGANLYQRHDLIRSLRDEVIPTTRSRLLEQLGVGLPDVSIEPTPPPQQDAPGGTTSSDATSADDVVVWLQGVPVIQTALEPEQAHVEAHELEHLTSPALADELAEALGNPTHDPHGSPIPSAEGTLPGGRTSPHGDTDGTGDAPEEAPGESARPVDEDARGRQAAEGKGRSR